jgi:hypothetical protein
MRIFYGLLFAFAVGLFSTQALADVQSYCEVFSQDFANGKISDVDAWEVNFRNAFGDCMAQYTAGVGVEAQAENTIKKVVRKAATKVVIVPTRDFSRKRRIPILEPGSIAWNKYCAAKYSSFNPVTGNYKSHAGKEKPCLTPD